MISKKQNKEGAHISTFFIIPEINFISYRQNNHHEHYNNSELEVSWL